MERARGFVRKTHLLQHGFVIGTGKEPLKGKKRDSGAASRYQEAAAGSEEPMEGEPACLIARCVMIMDKKASE